MMRNIKRSLAVLTAGMMCLMGTAAVMSDAVQIPVLTASAEEVSITALCSLTYEVRDDHIAITSFDNSETDVVIPEEIDGLPVEEIGEGAFRGASKLKSVEIPSCVTTIGARAFQGCISLEEIVLPEDLNSLGVYAFENCTSLKSAWFLFGPSYIPEGAFKNCGALNDVHFSIAVTRFYMEYTIYAVRSTDIFYGCNLQDAAFASPAFPQRGEFLRKIAAVF